MASAALLSAPGVRVAVADESASARVEQLFATTDALTSGARSCSADPRSAERVQEASIQQARAQMRSRIAATRAASLDPGRHREIVVLNNRGFNYQSGEPFAAPSGAVPKPPE